MGVRAHLAEHIPRLRRYARALTGDAARADDLVQDTLERALRKLALWRPGSDLRAWLFTLMHNVYVNQREPNRQVSWQPWEEDGAGEGSAAPTVDSPQEETLKLRDLARGLAQLSPEHKEVLLLVALEGLRYEEVAQVVGVPVGTVMSRLARARQQLRNLMEGERGSALRRVK